jgi:hypothetical protein
MSGTLLETSMSMRDDINSFLKLLELSEKTLSEVEDMIEQEYYVMRNGEVSTAWKYNLSKLIYLNTGRRGLDKLDFIRMRNHSSFRNQVKEKLQSYFSRLGYPHIILKVINYTNRNGEEVYDGKLIVPLHN